MERVRATSARWPLLAALGSVFCGALAVEGLVIEQYVWLCLVPALASCMDSWLSTVHTDPAAASSRTCKRLLIEIWSPCGLCVCDSNS